MPDQEPRTPEEWAHECVNVAFGFPVNAMHSPSTMLTTQEIAERMEKVIRKIKAQAWEEGVDAEQMREWDTPLPETRDNPYDYA